MVGANEVIDMRSKKGCFLFKIDFDDLVERSSNFKSVEINIVRIIVIFKILFHLKFGIP